MGSILKPGYVRWDGLKYVLDPDVEIVGPPGPAGAAGAQGSAGPTGAAGSQGLDGDATLVYQPGGTAAGNVYTSWTSLMTKRATVKGPMTIVIDDSFQATNAGATIDVGTWALNKNTKIVGYKGPQTFEYFTTPQPYPISTATQIYPILNLVNGAILHDPHCFENICIIGTGASHSILSSSFSTLDIDFLNCLLFANGSANLIFSTGGTMNLFGQTFWDGFDSNSFIFDGGTNPTKNMYFNLYDSSTISKTSIVIQSGGG